MAGVVLLVSPIPLGLIFLALGLSLLVSTSDDVAQRMGKLRQRYHRFDHHLHRVERKLEHRFKFVSAAVAKTRPPIEERRSD